MSLPNGSVTLEVFSGVDLAGGGARPVAAAQPASHKTSGGTPTSAGENGVSCLR